MNVPSEKIISKNFVCIKRKYFEEIVEPVLNRINLSIEPVTKIYYLAGKIVCLKFYSKIMAEKFSMAISHNVITADSSIDLTIHIWDSISTETQLVSPWINPDYYNFDPKLNEMNFITDSFLGVYLAGEQSLSFYDKKDKTAYFWVSDAKELPAWVICSPVRTILHWFLSEFDIHLIHGAVIALNEQSVLLTAKGGSGKSTTALSCILSGMNYLADDYVGIELGDEINCHCLYNSGKLVWEYLNTFPSLKEKVWNKNNLYNEKAIIFLDKLFPEQVIRKAKLKAIMIPVIKNLEKTRIVPASKMEAMRAIAPTTLFQLPLKELNKIKALKKLITRVPCYFLELS